MKKVPSHLPKCGALQQMLEKRLLIVFFSLLVDSSFFLSQLKLFPDTLIQQEGPFAFRHRGSRNFLYFIASKKNNLVISEINLSFRLIDDYQAPNLLLPWSFHCI
jgi:hypothetical protein